MAQESHKHSRPGFSFLSAPPCLAENLILNALSWSNNGCRCSSHRDPIPVNRKEESGSYRKGSSRTPTQPLEGRLRNVTYRSVPRVPLVKKGVGAGWMPTGLCCVWPTRKSGLAERGLVLQGDLGQGSEGAGVADLTPPPPQAWWLCRAGGHPMGGRVRRRLRN